MNFRHRAATKMGVLSAHKGLPTATRELEEGFQRRRVAGLVARLPRSLRHHADEILSDDPQRADASYQALVLVREKWIRSGRYDRAAIVEDLMAEAFVAGCDASRQGIVVSQPQDWDSPGTVEEPSPGPEPREKETMEFRRIYSSKIIKDGRRRRGAWVTKWRGWFNPRRHWERDVADVAWARLPRLVDVVEQRVGVYAVCWLIRGEAWVLYVGWGRDVRQAAATKALELGYEVGDKRLAVAVHYMPDARHARVLAEDMAWLYAAPLNLRSIDE